MSKQHARSILTCGAMAMLWLTGCADPCVDDGLAQDAVAGCAAMQGRGTATDGPDDAATAGPASPASASGDGESGPADGDGSGATAADPDGDTAEPTLWCLDADGDGFGDPDDCVESDEPVDGRVPNADDCDDGSATTFPGAAELELDDPGACRRDDDDDGWGDADPGGGGVVGGSDCRDSNGALNPGTMTLSASLPFRGGPGDPRRLAAIDVPLAPMLPIAPADVSLDLMVTLYAPDGSIPAIDIVSATLDPMGRILGSDTRGHRLYEVEYDAAACEQGGTVVPLSQDTQVHGAPDDDNVVCGVEHGPDGHLYGVNYRSELLTLDPVTGEAFERRALAGVEIESCAMAFDCREGRLLLANGRDRTIYEVDVAAATVATLVELSAQLPDPWLPTGLEYDPVTGWAWLSTGPELHYVELADGGQAWTVGSFVEPVTHEAASVSNLQYLPACG